MKTLSLILAAMFSLIFIPSLTAAQDNEVCLVYFTTSSGCGDECTVTDSFMDGLENEYSDVLLAITYDISIGDNANVFEAYKYNYELPDSVPIVLFAPRDYLQGRTTIFGSTESKIVSFLDSNGSNCPLDSGYLPPSQVGGSPGSLPGTPQVTGLNSDAQDGQEQQPEIGEDGEIPDGGGQPQEDVVEIDFQKFVEDPTSPESLPVWIIIAAVFIAIALVTGLTYGRGKPHEKG